VGRPGVNLALAADERAVLDARDVRRVRPREKRAGAQRGIERLEGPGLDERPTEAVEGLGRPVETLDPVRLGERRNLLDPCEQSRVLRRRLGLDHGALIPSLMSWTFAIKLFQLTQKA